MTKWQFQYGYALNMTVTVKAWDYDSAVLAAKNELDRRYAKRGWEPPVAWSLMYIR